MTLTLEVGKTYVDLNSRKWTIKTNHGWIYVAVATDHKINEVTRAFKFNGEVFVPKGMTSNVGTSAWPFENLVKEYREPVVHQRDVIWTWNPHKGEVEASLAEKGQQISFGLSAHSKVLSRQTVSYIEE